MSLRNKLDTAEACIQSAKEELDRVSNLEAIAKLMEAIRPVDRYYKNDFCKELDKDYGEPEGTTYKDGISLEFYVEAADWHNISLAFRELDNDSKS